MPMRFSIPLGIAAALFLAAGAPAQQTIQYDAVANPYLLLVRERAVWDDLTLSSKQKLSLRALNARIDVPFLALRNWSNEAADRKLAQLVAETETEANKILSREQQLRVKQIMLRVRGIECVDDEAVAAALDVSSKQRETLRTIIKDTRQSLAALRAQVQAGKPREPLEKEYADKRTGEQKQILAELTAKQKEKLTMLVGRTFDLSQLGKVSFRAPEIVPGGQWLNSEPLRMADLKGRVVAVHLWTYG